MANHCYDKGAMASHKILILFLIYVIYFLKLYLYIIILFILNLIKYFILSPILFMY